MGGQLHNYSLIYFLWCCGDKLLSHRCYCCAYMGVVSSMCFSEMMDSFSSEGSLKFSFFCIHIEDVLWLLPLSNHPASCTSKKRNKHTPDNPLGVQSLAPSWYLALTFRNTTPFAYYILLCSNSEVANDYRLNSKFESDIVHAVVFPFSQAECVYSKTCMPLKGITSSYPAASAVGGVQYWVKH